MKDLTNEEKEQLLGNVKSFLSITWDDTNTDNKLWGFIVSSINRLDDVYGDDLDYLIDENNTYTDKLYIKASFLAKELLSNRVFYINEKGLDDFEDNYRGELVSLNLLGKIHAQQQ